MKFRSLIFDFINGIHSGLPLCCVIFYLFKSLKTHEIAYVVSVERNELVEHNSLGMKVKNHIEYVQCNRCYKNHKIVSIKNNGMIAKWLVE